MCGSAHTPLGNWKRRRGGGGGLGGGRGGEKDKKKREKIRTTVAEAHVMVEKEKNDWRRGESNEGIRRKRNKEKKGT